MKTLKQYNINMIQETIEIMMKMNWVPYVRYKIPIPGLTFFMFNG